jgi:hypothetical protein
MQGAVQALKAAGLPAVPGAQFIKVQAPTPDSSVPLNETAKALSALVGVAQKQTRGPDFLIATAKALGFIFEGDSFPVGSIPSQKDGGIIRYFSIAQYHGKDEIIIDEIRRIDGRKELRSYWITPAGELQAAALTVKVNGSYVAQKVPADDAQTGCRALLEYWVQYYRDNLKR